jgi:hypothetical protein
MRSDVSSLVGNALFSQKKSFFVSFTKSAFSRSIFLSRGNLRQSIVPGIIEQISETSALGRNSRFEPDF